LNGVNSAVSRRVHVIALSVKVFGLIEEQRKRLSIWEWRWS
jgi:hypothetical protein